MNARLAGARNANRYNEDTVFLKERAKARMFEVTEDEFEEAVRRGIECIPARFRDQIDNVAFCMQDEPDAGQRASMVQSECRGRRELLGLYSGIPLSKRGADYGGYSSMPDMITVFKGPHERMAWSKESLFENVRKTVVHEVGHYFGLDEDQLRAMGYGSS